MELGVYRGRETTNNLRGCGWSFSDRALASALIKNKKANYVS
jgi:hypothetical protein